MADRPSGAGSRVIALLAVVLVGAIAIVVWLAMRPDAPPPAPPKPPPKPRASEAPLAPKAPRPKTTETLPVAGGGPGAEPGGMQAPQEPEERETVKLAVLVLGSNGAPAPGATVLLLDPFAQHVGTPRPPELARTKTDDAGRAAFEVTARTLRLFAWLGNEAGASDKVGVTAAKPDVVVRLSTAIAVHGRVAETGGAPVADAAVRLVASPWYDDPFGLVLETKSAADGTFDLPSLPASAFDAEGAAFAIEARAKSWPMTRVPVTADTLRAGEVVVTLERGCFVRGRLVRPDGTAVLMEEVRLADGRARTISVEEGRFELPLPRTGGVVLAMRRVVGAGPTDTPAPTGFGAPKLLGRFRGDGGDIDLGDVTLSPGQPVKGVVVDSSEQPFKAADVVLYLAGVPVAQTQTDDAGKFQFDRVGDDSHLLVATEAPGENAWTGRRHANVDGVQGGGADVRVVITGALTVVVKFQAQADRSPVVVPEVTLRATATGATPKGYGWTWAGTRIDSVRFEVEHAGTYDVTVTLPGYEPATATGVEVSADSEKEIDVLFRRLP